MKEIVGYASVILFLGMSLYEILIASLNKKFRIPPVLVTVSKWIANTD